MDSEERQEEVVDVDEHQEISPTGRPLEETSSSELQEGVELEEDPHEIQKENHPTPDHPIGRIEP